MKLFPHARGSWVQDTKTGIQVWSGPESQCPSPSPSPAPDAAAAGAVADEPAA